MVLECDENAHESYNFECERIRENNICIDLGLPTVFLRYNPDKKINYFGKNISDNCKLIVMKSHLEYYTNLKNLNPQVNFIFY